MKILFGAVAECVGRFVTERAHGKRSLLRSAKTVVFYMKNKISKRKCKKCMFLGVILMFFVTLILRGLLGMRFLRRILRRDVRLSTV